jgi:hypothetical protein
VLMVGCRAFPSFRKGRMRAAQPSSPGILAVVVVAAHLSASFEVRAAVPAKTPVASPSTIMGWIGPVNHVTGSRFLNLTGWAADARSGGPAARVEILLNDKVVGQAVVGEVRRELVQALKRPDFLKSGWKAEVDLKAVRTGTYRLAARAWNARGESAFLNTGPVNIKVP